MIPSIGQLAAMLIGLAIAWGVPVVYLLLCVIPLQDMHHR